MTRRIAVSILLALGIAFTLPASARQTRDAAPPPQATCRISGTVVGAESGRPVRFAKVSLASGAGSSETITDDSGTFVFDRLRAGAYAISVSRPGYLDTQYGQVRPGTHTPGKRIALADREQIERLVIPLSQGGAISGVVRDDRGDPLYRAHVRISRWVMQNGRKTLQDVESTETDERGRYRVSLLPPRSYVVSAAPAEDAIPELAKGPSTHGFAPMFFPSAPSARSASTVPLALGEDRSDVDIQLPIVALGRVTGVILGADGRPVPNVPVALAHPELEGSEHGAETDGRGRFEFERVAPGTYNVTAGSAMGHGHVKVFSKMMTIDGAGEFSLAIDAKRELAALARSLDKGFALTEAEPAAKGVPPGSAIGEVSVTSSNTSDVVLTLDPPRSVAGRIVTEGATRAPALRGTVIVLSGRSSGAETLEAKVTENGTFVIAGVAPGKYEVSFMGEAPPWNLSSATSSGVDALDFLLDVPRDRDVRDLVLTLKDRSSELSGSVTDASATPAGERTVILFPTDERFWVAGERRIRAANLQADGKFVFDDVRPGAYLIAVTDGVEHHEWLDPDFLRKLVPAGVPVSVAEGEKKVQDLRIR